MSDIADRILPLPKAELHVHLLGAIPTNVLVELFNRHPPRTWRPRPRIGLRRGFRRQPNIRPFLKLSTIDEEGAAALFQYDSFQQFLWTFCFAGFLVRDEDDLRMLIGGVVDDLRVQNVTYAEVTVSPLAYTQHGMKLETVAACLEDAAQRTDIRVRWIVDLIRDIGPKAALDLLRDVIDLQCPSIVGITLGGSEHDWPPAQFADVYALARDAGLRLTVHAGEALGPESVWDALRVLGAERIGHGIRSIEDPELVAHLAERQVPLEVCPTSNVCTGVVESYDAHPVRALFDAGVPITISTDDPAFFHTTLTDEFVRLHGMDFSEDELLELIENGFRHAFAAEGQA